MFSYIALIEGLLYSLLEMDKRYAIVQRNEWKNTNTLCSRRLISALQSSSVKGTLTLGALRAFRVGQMDHEQVLCLLLWHFVAFRVSHHHCIKILFLYFWIYDSLRFKRLVFLE